jgi:microcompartment protein CcmL/EutN
MRPALAMLEFDSIAAGIDAADAMSKRADVETFLAGSIHPGRYLVLVAGHVADVEESVDAGRARGDGCLVDAVILRDVHPGVVAALVGERSHAPTEALGIVETSSVAATLEVADAGLKAADVALPEMRLGDGIGGKGYLLFAGTLADVEEAVRVGLSRIRAELVVAVRVIPRLDRRVLDNLAAEPRFRQRVRSAGSER